MPNGTVKFFNAAKGFGFITSDDGNKDVFVPAASVAAAGVSSLESGQRVSFETKADSKGPKAVNLALIEGVASPAPVKEHPHSVPDTQRKPQLTFYHDPACAKSRAMLAELHVAGYEPRLVDYVAVPLTRDELMRLSAILRHGDGSLVRRHDPLFHDLRLDDRFISQNEFWDVVAETPSLINGPIVATASEAGICRMEKALKSFLAAAFPDRVQPTANQKGPSEQGAMSGIKEPAAPVAPQRKEAAKSKTTPAKSVAAKSSAGAKKNA
jgi:CspA family cold shock protein